MSASPVKLPELVPPERLKATVAPPVGIRLPASSLPVRVTVEVEPEAMVAEETEISEAEAEMVPTVTVTLGEPLVTAEPPTVAVMLVEVPASTPVNEAVYRPFDPSAVLPKVPVLVPPDLAKTTVEPPLVNWLPLASLAVNVTVMLLPEITEPAETLTSDWASDRAPAVTATMGDAEVTGEPLIVARIEVAVPATIPVNVAV